MRSKPALTYYHARINEIQSRVELDDRRRKIVNFFLKVNPQPNFQTAMRLRQPLTGLWLTESNQTYLKWRDIPSSSLWLSGIPGAGKTVLCGVVIDEVLQLSNDSTAVAFHFCDYKNQDSQKLINILCSIAVQLSQQNREAFSLLEDQFELLNPSGKLPKEPETGMLLDLIPRLSSFYEKVYLVVDGVDECGAGMGEVAAELRQLSEVCRTLSLAIFSRNEQEIHEELSESFAHLEIAAHTKDIDLYVCAEMGKRRQLKKIRLQSPDLAEEIREKLVNGAEGMFRWVACQLDYLCELTTNRARLSSLPPTLPETYHRILFRILQAGPEVVNLVRKSLHWISLDRHLSLDELREAVSIPETTIPMFSDDDWVDTDRIVEECRSFIRKRYEKLPTQGKPCEKTYIEFAHFTVEEYLKRIDPDSDVGIFRLEEETALIELSMTCLRSVLMRNVCFNNGGLGKFDLVRNITRTFYANPFYYYSICMLCGTSFTDDKQHDIIWTHIEESAVFEAWVSLFGPEKSPSFVALAFGALLGTSVHNPTISELLVSDDCKLDEESDVDNIFQLLCVVLSSNFTPLKLAAALGLPRLWLMLFQKPRSGLYETIQSNLCCAIKGPRIFIPKELFRDFFCRESKPFHCRKLREKTATQMLRINITPESITEAIPQWPQLDRTSPLLFAILGGQESIVEALLRHGLTLSSTQLDLIRSVLSHPVAAYDNILRILAARQSPIVANLAITRVPLKGPENAEETTDADGDWVLPPSVHLLARAISRGDVQLCKRLFNIGISVDVDLPGCVECPKRPLYLAIENLGPFQYGEILGLILEQASLDDSHCGKHALGLRNAISLSIWHGAPRKHLGSMLDIFLRHGSLGMDLDLSPFHVAALARSLVALQQLQSHVQKNFLAYRALYRHLPWAQQTSWKEFFAAAASRVSHYSSAMELDWPLGKNYSGSALHYAIDTKHQQCIKFFIDCGADLNVLDEYQRSPLILAAILNNFEAVKSLVAAGADSSIHNHKGTTALMWAVENGSMEMVELLDKAGSDHTCDYLGNTTFHRAQWHISLAPKLFSYFWSRGCDPLRRLNVNGLSTITYAFYLGKDTELMTVILNSGLLFEISAGDTGNPLSYAAEFDDYQLLRSLLRLYNRWGMIDDYLHRGACDAHAPLCNAAVRGFVSCIDELLKYGPKMDHEGCLQGSALMGAATYGRIEATKKLVRSGASISYTNSEGVYRNAFEAGKRHAHIRKWFLVDRFRDQNKLTANPYWGDEENPVVKEWSGITKVEWRLTGANLRRHDESRFDYLCRIQEIKEDARVQVMVRDTVTFATSAGSS